MCTCPRRPEVLGPLQLELQATEAIQGWELNSGPLEQYMLWATEPPLQLKVGILECSCHRDREE